MTREKVTVSVRIDKDVKEQFEQMCKSMGLNISDAINIFVRKVVAEEAIPFDVKLKRGKSRQEDLDTLFPPADAESVMELLANMWREENEDKPVMVDSSGQRNIVSSFTPHSIGKATHDNLLDVIPVESKE